MVFGLTPKALHCETGTDNKDENDRKALYTDRVLCLHFRKIQRACLVVVLDILWGLAHSLVFILDPVGMTVNSHLHGHISHIPARCTLRGLKQYSMPKHSFCCWVGDNPSEAVMTIVLVAVLCSKGPQPWLPRSSKFEPSKASAVKLQTDTFTYVVLWIYSCSSACDPAPQAKQILCLCHHSQTGLRVYRRVRHFWPVDFHRQASRNHPRPCFSGETECRTVLYTFFVHFWGARACIATTWVQSGFVYVF